jgi:kynurenine formamidase
MMTSPPDDAPLSAVRGFASIDYRLSPNANVPQDPDTTPPSQMRLAKHPDHITDVRSALRLLDDEYHMGSNYVLIGHSAGATLAFQLLMGAGNPPKEQGPVVPPPAAVVGISGIYDLAGIDERHNGDYSSFLVGAFGEDRDAWRPASPALFEGSYSQEWSRDCIQMLAWSPEDTLIDEPGIDDMAKKLKADGVEKLLVVKDLHGDHDVVWEEGSQIPRLFATVLDNLNSPRVL